jgi:hypothetical protein
MIINDKPQHGIMPIFILFDEKCMQWRKIKGDKEKWDYTRD